jgi:predicted esterase
MSRLSEGKGPHQGQPVVTAGASLEEATAAMILVHGRGASAANILTLAEELDRPDVAYLAPQAANSTWYPHSFLAPTAQNEPGLSSALAVLDELAAWVTENGVPAERLVLLGFSQGACLALTYAARWPRPYGGVVGLSGGLIGPPGTTWPDEGSLAGTPVFLGCSDVDPHIPEERVRETAVHFRRREAEVTLRLYPGMGHLVNQDEMDFVRGLMVELA